MVLLVIAIAVAIAGGTIVHPVLFALAIVALVVFFMSRSSSRGRGRRVA